MTNKTSEYSPYAPIRLRETFWWPHAQQLAKEGFIQKDGQIAGNLPDVILQHIIAPAMAIYKEAEGENRPIPMFSKLLELRQWIPLIGQYELCERQIFDLHEDLVNMLDATDSRDVTLADWKPPYDCFFVRFGKRESLKLPFHESKGISEFVDGSFVAVTPMSDNPESPQYRFKFGITTVKDDGRGTMIHGHFVDLMPDECKFPVEKAICLALERRIHERENDTSEATHGLNDYRIDDIKEHFDLFKKAANLIANSLFYIESLGGERRLSPGRDVPPSLHHEWTSRSPERRRKTTSKFTRMGYSLVYLLGSEFSGQSRESVSGGKKMHWVRGHFRRQAHGKDRALRKTIWIKPHPSGTKGSIEDAEGHIYITSPSGDKAH